MSELLQGRRSALVGLIKFAWLEHLMSVMWHRSSVELWRWRHVDVINGHMKRRNGQTLASYTRSWWWWWWWCSIKTVTSVLEDAPQPHSTIGHSSIWRSYHGAGKEFHATGPATAKIEESRTIRNCDGRNYEVVTRESWTTERDCSAKAANANVYTLVYSTLVLRYVHCAVFIDQHKPGHASFYIVSSHVRRALLTGSACCRKVLLWNCNI